MGLKKLTNNEEVVRLTVPAESGLFIFTDRMGKSTCIIAANFSGDEAFFHDLDNVTKFRYLGSEKLYNEISGLDYHWLCNLERTVFTTSDVEILYLPEMGKVRFLPSRVESTDSSAISASVSVPKKVLIIDDSKSIQKLLSRIIAGSSEFEVMACAGSPSEARSILEKEKPDLITLDIHMPEMTGVEFLKTYLNRLAIPVVMISSVTMQEGPLVMDALANGATTYIQKPSIDKIDQGSQEILSTLLEVSRTKVRAPLLSQKGISKEFSTKDGLIAIGSSTGGTQALQVILESLPEKIPPIVIVQHIPAVFSKALADRLNNLCAFTVAEAKDGDLVARDKVLIAPGGKQMKLARRGSETRVVITDDLPVNRFKPSVDYLFDSVAQIQSGQVLGIILTGMGKDGARGLLNLHNHNAVTIAQDETSSIVFGMPREAIALGAADHVVGLDSIARKMVELFGTKKVKRPAA